MKREVEYDSSKVLPEEIEEYIKTCTERIIRDRSEPDKIRIGLMGLRGSLIRWFAEHEKIDRNEENKRIINEC